MDEPYAEVIGDPIGHSMSPVIHRYWLRHLGLEGDYRATRVGSSELAPYFASRCADPFWRGCNVTAPHKEAVIPFLSQLSDSARAVGAVNLILPRNGLLEGRNSDIEGIALALAGAALGGKRAVVIGAGGAARAAVYFLLREQIGEVCLIARNPKNAAPLLALDPLQRIRIEHLADAARAISGSAIIINASPLGMTNNEEMPGPLLEALSQAAPGTLAFDMVYKPLETTFLKAAAAAALRPVDGLVMLVGQARAAFDCFFGAEPPPSADGALREQLARKTGD